MEEKFITIVDIGSYRTAACTAKIEGRNIDIAAYKEAPSDGVRHGRVFNPLRASTVVKSLLTDIERQLGIKISKVVTGIPGYGINTRSITLKNDRTSPDDFITSDELNSMTELAYSRTEDENERVYCVIPQSYRIGDAMEIPYDDAIGMSGPSIEGKYRIFAGNKAVFDSNEKTFKAIDIEIAGKYLYPMASAESTLLGQEKQNGVALVEFGGNTANLVIYYKNIIRYIYTLPFGGKNITDDIANECKITAALAESIKRDFGSAMPEKLSINAEKSLQIKSRSQRDIEIPIKYLSEIIEARCKEIFDALLYKIEESGYADLLSSGIVLTGGSANLLNISDYLKTASGYSVRRAMPVGKFSYTGFPKLSDFSSSAISGLLALAWEDCIGFEDSYNTAGTTVEDIRTVREPDTADNAGSNEETCENGETARNDSSENSGTTWIKGLFGGMKKDKVDKKKDKGDKKKEDRKKDNRFSGFSGILFEDDDNI